MDYLEQKTRKPHLKERSNFVSNLFFIYALRLFKKGFKKDLEEKDLYDVLNDFKSKKLGDRFENEWQKQKNTHKNPSVLRLILSCYGLTYFLLGLMDLVIKMVDILVVPYALAKLTAYFRKGQTEITKTDAYFYAVLVIGTNLFQAVCRQNWFLMVTSLAIKTRAAFCSFIYRKTLKLEANEAFIGKIVTIISKDVEIFEQLFIYANNIWVSLVQITIMALILYRRIGLATLAGIGVFMGSIPLQIALGCGLMSLKLKMYKKSDERLQVTQETLSSMKILKMYTWENIWCDKIRSVRKKEMSNIFRLGVVKFFISAFCELTGDIALYVTLMTYIWLQKEITAEILFFTVATFFKLNLGFNMPFAAAVIKLFELVPTLRRIGSILKATETETEEFKNNTAPRIALKKLTVAVKKYIILENIDLVVEDGLTAIIGPVGGGKTLLLRTILQDCRPQSGTVTVRGSISYASQDPWLFPSTIKQNILFGEKYDERRYLEVVKVCALIYDFQMLEAGDGTIVEDCGINLSKGQQVRINLARAIYKQSDIYLLDDCLALLDAYVSAFVFKECIKKFLKDKIVLFVTHNFKYATKADNTIILKERKANIVEHSGELENESNLIGGRNTEIKDKPESISDLEDDLDENTNLLSEVTPRNVVYHEDKKYGEVDSIVYKKYLKFGGGYFVFFLIVCIFVVYQFSRSYVMKVISHWANIEEKHAKHNSSNTAINISLERNAIFYKYSFLIAVLTVANISKTIAMEFFARRASIKLHKSMVKAITNACLSFFDQIFIGNILNRFSKDLTVVDERISTSLISVIWMVFLAGGLLAMIASVNAYFLIPIAIFLVLLMLLKKMVLRTARSLKRLDASTKSPIVGQMNSTVEGLTTIRAFKVQKILANEFDCHQDLYTSATYMFQCSIRAFAFMLDMCCLLFTSCIILKFLIRDDGTSSGQVGLALSEASALTSVIQWTLFLWVELETHMTSVERILEYTKIKQETTHGQRLENWPDRGKIAYQNVFLSYDSSRDKILKNISFTVKPREKVGIVGRTASGKSSIISILFRLYDYEGRIAVDDVDIKKLSLRFLRSNISIIPQDPLLFTGTIRDNIDPSGCRTDEEIWAAVHAANLQEVVTSLDLEITDSGSNFSVGQRQLICLVRALIRKNKIVVLDEATANIDSDIDDVIQKIIEENFEACTVLTIAHRLHTILKCDKVLVIDKGEIVEFDRPSSLLENKDGVFARLLMSEGPVLGRKSSFQET